MFDISIVIVNYNVKDYLFQCLNSILNSKNDLKIEIIVVDNNSSDNSIALLEPKFDKVNFIQLNENLGFGKANNIGINKSNGKYTLLLNPDTLLSDNTLSYLFKYMEENSDVAISTCKILNGDGTFQQACRRGFPTPMAAFSKLFGLQKIFPNSKVFGKYNLSYLNDNEINEVEAISGSFMFFRSKILKQIGGFDEDFFMYGEDLDICYRVKKLHQKIMFLPETSTIHYKGESTKRSNANDIKIFFDAMQIFVTKHYSKSFFFLSFLKLGIFLRSVFSYLLRYKRDFALIVADALTIIIAVIIGTYIVFGSFFAFPSYAYPIVFILPPIILISIMILIGEYFENDHRISKSFFGMTILFMTLSTLTYFFPDFRFSRGIVLFTTILGIISASISRIILQLYDKYQGNNKISNILIVGDEQNYNTFIREFGLLNPGSFQIFGYVNERPPTGNTTNSWLGKPEQLESIIKDNLINNIIIADKTWNIDSIKQTLNSGGALRVKYHFASQYSDFLASQIINDILNNTINNNSYRYTLLRYRIIKRLFDIVISLLLLIILLPFSLFLTSANKFTKELYQVFKGRKTIIGIIPEAKYKENFKHSLINFKNLNKNKIYDNQTIDKLNEFYLKNYSLSLDFDILLRKILGK
ncbi:MAG TPA: glycosyltransferase [Candidatus Kapabacteria bacterium]|nr:glycosyltransferase [Candidatus Kapabacteria bacterium]